jgi:hypothetical protein
MKLTDLHLLASRARCSAGEHDGWLGRELSARLSRLQPGERVRYECEESLILASPLVPGKYLRGYLFPLLFPSDF